MNNKTGVVVGRWQCPSLHKGHKHLINRVVEKSAQLVLIIGEAPISYTDRNPLPSGIVERMLKESYPEAHIYIVKDYPDDNIWSGEIDQILELYKYPTLYGSRDSFIKNYTGKYKTKEIKEKKIICSTDIRRNLKQYAHNENNKSFRKGIIHAIENRYPTAYPTVDVALLKKIGKNVEILLARKPNKTTWCFVGGFVDVKDSSLAMAAYRELNEEVKGIYTHELFYIGSSKIRDERYEGTKDGIITSLFGTYFMGGNPKAADDIEDVKWFDIKTFDKSQLSRHHHFLFDSLKEYLKL